MQTETYKEQRTGEIWVAWCATWAFCNSGVLLHKSVGDLSMLQVVEGDHVLGHRLIERVDQFGGWLPVPQIRDDFPRHVNAEVGNQQQKPGVVQQFKVERYF